MNILIIGGGGREHALAWKIAQSPLCTKLFCAPGNPGIAQVAECVSIEIGGDFAPLVGWCRDRQIDLVVVGPERPLADGVVDALDAAGIKAFGPTREGALLEGSKHFAKQLMQEANIPTGVARCFDDYDRAVAYLDTLTPPYVIKADGLAEGKGVTVAQSRDEALDALQKAMKDLIFGDAGGEVLVEECLVGEEASLLAFADGNVVKPMDSAQDHKAVFDGDDGPNTGGMGSYSPAPVVTPELYGHCVRTILEPCLEAFKKRGIVYKGIIYAGLMITKDGPKVIEFNCRFGDPETQALLPRMTTDLVEVMLACVEGRLDQIDLQWSADAAVCVVAASGGYPGPYKKGKAIAGLEKISDNGDVMVFHAGTVRDAGGQLVTNGGRVLGVTVRDAYLRVAIERVYDLMEHVKFDGVHYRTDIGLRALQRIGQPKS